MKIYFEKDSNKNMKTMAYETEFKFEIIWSDFRNYEFRISNFVSIFERFDICFCLWHSSE